MHGCAPEASLTSVPWQTGMLPGGLDAIYGVENEEDAQVGLSADALANLQSLERLEERVSVILLDDKAKVCCMFHM
jgi:hypothetical protein